MKILIIDDESIIRRSLKKAAEIKKHQVIEADNGITGLDLWKSEKPDLVFLDVLMPGYNGPKVLEMLGKGHGSKVVMISAYSGEFDHESFKNLGVNLFISKPFDDIFSVIKAAEDLFHGSGQ